MKPGDLVRESSQLVLPQYARIGLILKSESMSNIIEVMWQTGTHPCFRLKDNVELINELP